MGEKCCWYYWKLEVGSIQRTSDCHPYYLIPSHLGAKKLSAPLPGPEIHTCHSNWKHRHHRHHHHHHPSSIGIGHWTRAWSPETQGDRIGWLLIWSQVPVSLLKWWGVAQSSYLNVALLPSLFSLHSRSFFPQTHCLGPGIFFPYLWLQLLFVISAPSFPVIFQDLL